MTATDLHSMIRLTDQEHWGFGTRDLKRMMALQPGGCLVATIRGRPIGLTTTIAYGKDLGWIGNVVVNQKYRGAGIGSRLVQSGINHLLRAHVKRIGLNSYPENEAMYKRLGFKTKGSFASLSTSHSAGDITGRIVKTPFRAILRLDKRAFGADRARLLRRLHREFPKCWTWISNDSRASGYSLVKQYRDSSEIGPLICKEMNQENAAKLLRSSIALANKWPLEMSVPEPNSIIMEVGESLGFRVERRGVMMTYASLDPIVFGPAVGALGFLDKG